MKIISATRRTVTMLAYPKGHTFEGCAANDCTGKKDCRSCRRDFVAKYPDGKVVEGTGAADIAVHLGAGADLSGYGDCACAKPEAQLIVAVTLDDGRSTRLFLAASSTDKEIVAATKAWAASAPLPVTDPLAGASI